MKRRFVVVGLLVLVPLTVWAANTIVKLGRHTVVHVIDQTGDTAKVYKVNLLHGHDSFAYIDTVYATTTPIAVTWVSHPTVRRINIAASVAVSLHDSILIDHGTGVDTITVDCDPALTRAAYADSLVVRINADSLADSVRAQDSGTYVKVIAAYMQETMTGDARFAIAYGAVNHNLTAGTTDSCSVKMICDSMSAKINATVTVSDTVTAANSGDTVYTVTSDRKGYDITLSPGDTIQKGDTTVLTANKASWTHHTDTIPLFSMYQNGWKGMWGRIIIPASANTEKGYGTLDSCYVKLNAVTGYGQRFAVLNDSSNHIPDTFFLAKIDNDTLWKEYLELVVKVADSATDTALTANHDIGWYLIPVE